MVSGTVKSEPGFEPALDAQLCAFSHENVRGNSSVLMLNTDMVLDTITFTTTRMVAI